MNLARELGAEVIRLEGTDVSLLLAGSVIDKFMRLVPEVDIVVIGARP